MKLLKAGSIAFALLLGFIGIMYGIGMLAKVYPEIFVLGLLVVVVGAILGAITAVVYTMMYE